MNSAQHRSQLMELSPARQHPGEHFRRVWMSEDFSLVIWFEGEEPCGFELMYDRLRMPHSISKRPMHERISHWKVCDGEYRSGKAKQSPILQTAVRTIPSTIREQFESVAHELDSKPRSYVVEQLDCRAPCNNET